MVGWEGVWREEREGVEGRREGVEGRRRWVGVEGRVGVEGVE